VIEMPSGDRVRFASNTDRTDEHSRASRCAMCGNRRPFLRGGNLG
jgi:hypothetical protein